MRHKTEPTYPWWPATLLAVMLIAGAGKSFAMEDEPAVPSRPNIIFLLTDDQRDNTLGAMGHPFVKTPHLDRLLRESVRFEQYVHCRAECARPAAWRC